MDPSPALAPATSTSAAAALTPPAPSIPSDSTQHNNTQTQRRSGFSNPTPNTASYFGAFVASFGLNSGRDRAAGGYQPLSLQEGSTRDRRDEYEEGEDEAYEMVQTYGVARENNAEPVNGHDGDESRALLGGAGAGQAGKPDGRATLASCISNLSNTIMGTGTYFSIPFVQDMWLSFCVVFQECLLSQW